LQWDQSADEAVRLRHAHDDAHAMAEHERGKASAEEIQSEFADFLSVELRLRQERTSSARQLTSITVTVFLALTVIVNGLLAWLGRREMTSL
jgi:hypothetical protein